MDPPTIACIRWSTRHFTFHLNHSKTDQFFRGHDLRITRLSSVICPFKAMARYFARCQLRKPPGRTPLFFFASGSPLTRHSCLKHMRYFLLKAGYPPKSFNTHSLRIGAATSASNAGISSQVIKLLGRWKSGVYRRYIRTHDPVLKRAARQLGQPHTSHQ